MNGIKLPEERYGEQSGQRDDGQQCSPVAQRVAEAGQDDHPDWPVETEQCARVGPLGGREQLARQDVAGQQEALSARAAVWSGERVGIACYVTDMAYYGVATAYYRISRAYQRRR